jgi:hypothetical protein
MEYDDVTRGEWNTAKKERNGTQRRHKKRMENSDVTRGERNTARSQEGKGTRRCICP